MYKCKWFRCSATVFFPLVMFVHDLACQLTFWSAIFSSSLNMETSWVWLQSSENKNRTQFFRAGGGSWNKGTSLNISATNHKRKAPQGKILEFFLLGTLDTLDAAFRKSLDHKWNKSRYVFPISKEDLRDHLPPPWWTPVLH